MQNIISDIRAFVIQEDEKYNFKIFLAETEGFFYFGVCGDEGTRVFSY